MFAIALLVPVFAAALIAPWLSERTRWAGWLLALVPAGLCAWLLMRMSGGDGGVAASSWDWAEGLGLELEFRLDGLGMLFALLILGIGALVVVYAGEYLEGEALIGRFHGYLLAFMGGMLGLVLADNLLLLYVFWELTSVTSWLLIGFNHEQEQSRKAAWQALIVTASGGLALLAGLVLLGQIAGTYQISTLLERGEAVRGSGLYPAVLLLFCAGAFTKSAQVPFHFWLPNAMAAPTPVSAYLHSATMVKAGIYLLARFTPVLGQTAGWFWLVGLTGALTMLVGAWLSLIQRDLKAILAYTTISALGMMVLLLGVGGEKAIVACMVFIVAHGLYKGGLFLIAGILDHGTGTRDVTVLRGLWRAMPLTAAAAGVAWVSMAGIPPALGFIAHELLYEATQRAPVIAAFLTGSAVLASVFYVAAGTVVSIRPFVGAPMKLERQPHHAGVSMWLGPVLLAALGLLLGLWPTPAGGGLIVPAASATLAEAVSAKLALWHGWTLTLALSAVTVLLGVTVYWRVEWLRSGTAPLRRLARLGPSEGYDRLIAAMTALARLQTRWLQHGYLPGYVVAAIVILLALVGWPLVYRDTASRSLSLPHWQLAEIALAVITLVSALGTAVFARRVAAIVSMGVVGYSVTLYFVLYAAPDLAVTQFLVETLFVVLVTLSLPHLPRFTHFTTKRWTVLNLIIALAAGGLVTLTLLMVSAQPPPMEISEFYVRAALPEAQGRNVVNILLVDFRSLDTLVEITVLATSAIGVYVLLKLRGSEERG